MFGGLVVWVEVGVALRGCGFEGDCVGVFD